MVGGSSTEISPIPGFPVRRRLAQLLACMLGKILHRLKIKLGRASPYDERENPIVCSGGFPLVTSTALSGTTDSCWDGEQGDGNTACIDGPSLVVPFDGSNILSFFAPVGAEESPSLGCPAR